jgi:membrane-associated phospholipid phosphatase
VLALNGFDRFFLTLFSGLPDWLTPFFSLITQLGNPLVLVTLSAVPLVLGKGKFRAMAAILLIGLLLGYLVMNDLKNVVERLRPDDPRITNYLISASYSFPSGHALLTFLAASIIGGFLGWKFRLAGYFVASLVAISRLYLGVHYATDVLAGALIGLIIGEMAVYFAFRLGLCGSMGLAEMLRFSSLNGHRGTVAADGKPAGLAAYVSYYALIAVALILSIDAFNTGRNFDSLAFTVAAPLFVILTTRLRTWGRYPGLSLSFFVISIGFNVMFLGYIYESYRLSLLVFALMLIALLGLTLPKKRPAGY